MRTLSLSLLAVVTAAAVACSSGGGSHRGKSSQNKSKDLSSENIEETFDLSEPENPGDVDLKKSDMKAPDMKSTDLATSNTGPTVGTLAPSPSYAYDGESVTFTVSVGHPIGLDYLYTVELFDTSGYSYGSMSTSGFDGNYSLTLSWTQIDAVSPLNFTSSTSRSFLAKATDIDGKSKSTSSTNVSFYCSAGETCSGVCGGCSSGGTPTLTTCSTSYSGSETCSSICASLGKTCAETACGGKTQNIYYGGCSGSVGGTNVSCSTAISSGGYATSYGDGASCCCQ